MSKEPLAGLLKGTVTADETMVGGKPRKLAGVRPNGTSGNKRGRGSKKLAVAALIERDGRAIVQPVERVDAKTLGKFVRDHVDKGAILYTDEWGGYTTVGKEYAAHHVVNHGKREYARGPVSTNDAEAYFALLKRGITGSFHSISKQHLGRYCDEFSFRWNTRKITDGERTIEAIKSSEGRRLMYRDPITRN